MCRCSSHAIQRVTSPCLLLVLLGDGVEIAGESTVVAVLDLPYTFGQMQGRLAKSFSCSFHWVFSPCNHRRVCVLLGILVSIFKTVSHFINSSFRLRSGFDRCLVGSVPKV